MSIVYNAPTTNPPTLVTVATVVDLGALTAGKKYLVTLQNAMAADRAADPEGADWKPNIEGWIKTGAAADVAVEAGTPISRGVPVLVSPVAGKLQLSFIRNADTPYYCKVFVVPTDS